MKLRTLIESISPLQVLGDVNVEIKDIQFDSRKVTKGSLFVATVGTAVDGHNFINTAIAAGAKAIVCEKTENIDAQDATIIQVNNSANALGFLASQWYDNPSQKMCLVGVTGTNGKTSVTNLTADCMRYEGAEVA